MAEGIKYEITADGAPYQSAMRSAIDAVKDLSANTENVDSAGIDALTNSATAAAIAAKGLKADTEGVAEAVKKAAQDSIQAKDDEAKAARRLLYELGKVAAAQGQTPTATPTTGFGGMLDNLKSDSLEQVAGTAPDVKVLSENLAEAAESTRELGEEADGADDKVSKILNVQRAQVANQIAQSLGGIGTKIRETSAKFTEADPAFAETLTGVADGLDIATASAQGAALGFALAGPPGAAAGALIAGGLNLASQAFNDFTTAAANAAAAEQQSISLKERHAALISQLADEKREAAIQEVRDHNNALTEQDQRAVEHADFLRSEQQRIAANDRKRAADAVAEEEKSAARIRAAREKGFAAKLSPEDNLKRQISDLQAAGPTGRAAIDAAPDRASKEAIYQRTVDIYALEKQLETLQTNAAQKAAQEATAAERKAAAEEKTATARKTAAEEKTATARKTALATFEQENAILAARANGNEKLAKQLERQQAVEATKKQLMSEQGLGETQAAAAAERRQLLLEATAKREENPRRTRLYDAEESEARRADRMSAADKARLARWQGINAATDAAGNALANKPADERKDKTESMDKKLDRLKSIDQNIENLTVFQ